MAKCSQLSQAGKPVEDLGFPNRRVVGDLVAIDSDSDVIVIENEAGKVFLYQVAFVSGADNEVLDAMGRIDAEDMPKYRMISDFNQRFGAGDALLLEATAAAARQDY